MTLKVLMTTDTLGGVWTYSVDLIQALKPFGIDVILATMGGALTPDQRASLDGLSNVEVSESICRLEWMDSPWSEVYAAGDWLIDLEGKFRPDIIHLNGYAHAQWPFAVPKLVVAHSCVLTWWEAVKDKPAPSYLDRYRQEVSAGLANADHIVAPTQAMLDALTCVYDIHGGCSVISNARDQRYFSEGEKEPFVFSAGRLWDEAKNLSALESAATSISWPVYVAGEQEHPSGGSAPSEYVRSLGRLDQSTLAGWLSRASIYALPARYEPFGLSALEAALSGCALVLGDIPSLREVWGDAAVYAAPDDPEALAASIQGLIDSYAIRLDYAERAKKRAQIYSLRRMATQYAGVYADLLEARHARAGQLLSIA